MRKGAVFGTFSRLKNGYIFTKSGFSGLPGRPLGAHRRDLHGQSAACRKPAFPDGLAHRWRRSARILSGSNAEAVLPARAAQRHDASGLAAQPPSRARRRNDSGKRNHERGTQSHLNILTATHHGRRTRSQGWSKLFFEGLSGFASLPEQEKKFAESEKNFSDIRPNPVKRLRRLPGPKKFFRGP